MEANPYTTPAVEKDIDERSRPVRPVWALAELFTFLVIVFVGAGILPRITPPGGLVAFDFFLMFALPVGAYRAGKEWYYGPVFLVYGAIGMFLFIPGYLSDGRLKFKVATQAAVISHVAWWCIGVLLVATASWRAGDIAHASSRPRSEPEDNGQNSDAVSEASAG